MAPSCPPQSSRDSSVPIRLPRRQVTSQTFRRSAPRSSPPALRAAAAARGGSGGGGGVQGGVGQTGSGGRSGPLPAACPISTG